MTRPQAKFLSQRITSALVSDKAHSTSQSGPMSTLLLLILAARSETRRHSFTFETRTYPIINERAMLRYYFRLAVNRVTPELRDAIRAVSQGERQG